MDLGARRVQPPCEKVHTSTQQRIGLGLEMLEKDVTFALQGQGPAYQALCAEIQHNDCCVYVNVSITALFSALFESD
jgi:hypothetical protein